MAKVKVHKKKKMTFTLSEKEARYLADLLQNPIRVDPDHPETEKDAKTREGLFTCITIGLSE